MSHDPNNPMVEAPFAEDGMRWFRAVNPEKGLEGPWHLGPSKTGWPAGPAVCGYDQPDIKVDWHMTARGAMAHLHDFCPVCLNLAQLKAKHR